MGPAARGIDGRKFYRMSFIAYVQRSLLFRLLFLLCELNLPNLPLHSLVILQTNIVSPSLPPPTHSNPSPSIITCAVTSIINNSTSTCSGTKSQVLSFLPKNTNIPSARSSYTSASIFKPLSLPPISCEKSGVLVSMQKKMFLDEVQLLSFFLTYAARE